MRQRKMFVSPTLLMFQPTTEEEGNRVLRQFRDDVNRFVRLSFVNEHLEKGFYFSEQSHLFLGYIHHILINGIELGKNKVEFLSYSNSQIKSHSCWMLCTPFGPNAKKDMITADEIIQSLGNFDEEKNILKRYARRGQCFSTSKFVYQLQDDELQVTLEDIKRNGYVFTDGCGYISKDLCDAIASQYGFKQCSGF